MVTKPASVHLHSGTTTKIRIITLFISLAILAFGSYVIWLVYTILEFTVFSLAGLVILMASTIGVLIWLVLVTIQRTSFRKNREDLGKYKIKLRSELVTPKHP